jgi:hypothetical protein
MGDGTGGSAGAPHPPIDELDALFSTPDAWAGLDADILRQLLVYECVACGLELGREATVRLMSLARVAADRLHPAARLQAVSNVARAIERVHRQQRVRSGAGATSGLLPFILEDPDPSVVSAASCELAILLPLEGDDPLTGPRHVASLIEQVAPDDARAGIIGGLLLLGDLRVWALLDQAWMRLGDEGRQTLALVIQGFHGLHALTVRFLLGWLEHEAVRPDSATFGVVAATMARAGHHAAEFGVVDVRRTFPVIDAPEGRPYEVVREWPLHEFLPLVSGRLLALTSADPPPELVLAVIRHWGLGD